MRTVLTIGILILGIGITLYGCSGKTGDGEIPARTLAADLPYFIALEWPAICSELPEGRLIISGIVVFPAGPDSEIPIQLFVFADNGSCSREAGTGGEMGKTDGGQPEYDLDGLPYVQDLKKKVLAYLAKSCKGEALDDDFPQGCKGIVYMYLTTMSTVSLNLKMDVSGWISTNGAGLNSGTKY